MAKAAKSIQSMAEVIRAAIEESGMTINAVAKGAGVAQPVVYRFMVGERGLSLHSADKLCRYLGLKLVREEFIPKPP